MITFRPAALRLCLRVCGICMGGSKIPHPPPTGAVPDADELVLPGGPGGRPCVRHQQRGVLRPRQAVDGRGPARAPTLLLGGERRFPPGPWSDICGPPPAMRGPPPVMVVVRTTFVGRRGGGLSPADPDGR